MVFFEKKNQKTSIPGAAQQPVLHQEQKSFCFFPFRKGRILPLCRQRI
jgi:hypothetical protein